MNDLNISITVVAAIALWVLGAALAIVNLLVEPDFGAISMTLVAGGSVLTVRTYFCKLGRREQNAFDLGRDYERLEEPRRIRT